MHLMKVTKTINTSLINIALLPNINHLDSNDTLKIQNLVYLSVHASVLVINFEVITAVKRLC